MSKIVCDICGATYDDAAGSCPVCGWSQDGNLDVDAADLDTDFLEEELGDEEPAVPAAPAPKGKVAFDYDAVNNSHHRPAPKPVKVEATSNEDDDEDEDDEEEESGSNTFLVIILVILILALLGVSAYIGWTKILKPKQMGNENNKPQETVTAQVEETSAPTIIYAEPEEETTESGVPCTGLSLVGNMEKLTFAGQYWRLMVKSEPEDTTDTVVYTSGDESVVTIDEYGRVTAVGEGETVIVITCGDQRIETPAVVSYQAETTEAAPAETAPAATAAPEGNTAVATPTSTLKLKKTDITIGRVGVYVTLEIEGGIAAEDITWTTSDSGVATVYNGNVTALGRGICTITAEYNGQTAQCVVRCKF